MTTPPKPPTGELIDERLPIRLEYRAGETTFRERYRETIRAAVSLLALALSIIALTLSCAAL